MSSSDEPLTMVEAALIRLKEIRVQGRLPRQAETWRRQFGDALVKFDRPVAAFHR